MEKIQKKQFLRRAIKVGNSAGVLLPKSLLGSEVIVKVINLPLNINKDVLKILNPFFEELIGIYLIEIKEKKAEILAISASLSKQIENQNYKIDIVPLQIIRKSIKEKRPSVAKIIKAKPILNKRLLIELKKDAGVLV